MLYSSLLFICTGNICRSPLAAAICQHLAQHNQQNLYIDSAATDNYNVGDSCDIRSVEVAKLHGIIIGNHRARQLVASDFSNDLLLVMDHRNYDVVMSMAQKESLEQNIANKLIMLRGFEGHDQDTLPTYHKQLPIVADPYYGELQDFMHTYDVCNNAINQLLAYLKRCNSH